MERLCDEMSSIELEHTKAGHMTQDGNDLFLHYRSGRPDRKLQLDDLIIIIPAPLENGFVKSDHFILSVHRANSDPKSKAQEYSLRIDVVETLLPSLRKFRLEQLPDYLCIPKDNFHVVVSTLSGACDAEKFYDGVVKPTLAVLGALPSAYQLHRTTSDHSILDLAKQTWGPVASKGKQQTIILLSGDGGIVDTVNGIMRLPVVDSYVKPTIGLLALGTGNALANSSMLNSDSTKGLSSLLRGRPSEIPLFQAKFSPGAVLLTNEGQTEEDLPKDDDGLGFLHGAVVASWGLHAALVADSDTVEYRKFGSERFSMAAKELLTPSDGSDPHQYSGRVTFFRRNAKGQVYTEHWDRVLHSYLLATFVSNLEKALTISPLSQPLDGKLRLLHWGVLPSDEVMRIFSKAFDGGKHIDDPAVGYDIVEGLRIDFNETNARWRRTCIDGKIVKVEDGGWVEVRKVQKGAIDLVIGV